MPVESPVGAAALESVSDALTRLRAGLIAVERRFAARCEGISAANQVSARNLLHYLALRREDLRPLQADLAALGLSSLGRAESAVLASVDTVLEVVRRLADDTHVARRDRRLDGAPSAPVGVAAGRALLDAADHRPSWDPAGSSFSRRSSASRSPRSSNGCALATPSGSTTGRSAE